MYLVIIRYRYRCCYIVILPPPAMEREAFLSSPPRFITHINILNLNITPPPLLLLFFFFFFLSSSSFFFFFFLFFFFFFFFLSSSSFLLPFLFLLCKQANEFLLIYTVMKIQAVENTWKILTVYLTVMCPLHQTIYQTDSTKGFWLTAERTFLCLNPPPPCFNNG